MGGGGRLLIPVCSPPYRMGDHVQFTIRESVISFKVKNLTVGSGETALLVNSESLPMIEFRRTCQASFSIKYLALIAKGGLLGSDVEIGMAGDCPLAVKVGILGDGVLRYYLSPQNED